MSAAQPKQTEPSMEEILASIRRIIADDPQKAAVPQVPAPATAPPPAPVLPQPARAVDPDEDEVMDLKPKTRAREPHYITDDPVDNDISFVEQPLAAPVEDEVVPKSQDDIDALMSVEAAAEEPTPMPAPVAAAPLVTPNPAPAPAPVERLIAPEVDRAASSSFTSLTNTILTKNARTLDDLMQDMMRPMVKQWLDDNLPSVVERLVRAEIERVARGGR